MRRWIVVFALLQACSPASQEDFYHEGEAILRAMTEELKTVQTREQLVSITPQLTRYFHKLVDLSIEARRFAQESEELSDLLRLNHAASNALQEEMARIYRLEAGREVIEKAQKEALLKLDAFEHNLRK